MDPATIISLLAAAAGALGTEAIKDLYEAVKHRIKKLFAQDEHLLEALEDFEAKPQSGLKRKTLQEQIERTNLAKAPEVIEHLAKLEARLIHLGESQTAALEGSGLVVQGKKI
ncbi:MAG: hypothetical protein AB7T38_00215 [Nitrospirales bacterium]